jgi:predicted Zn-ribbon and HTH transcriptional regulator
MGKTRAGRRREAYVPQERYDTIRQYIIALLEEYSLSARQISGYLKIPEKDIYDHLEHIRKTLNKDNKHLLMNPASCTMCGFVYRKRDRVSTPGKCPLCHSSLIEPPSFSIVRYH